MRVGVRPRRRHQQRRLTTTLQLPLRPSQSTARSRTGDGARGLPGRWLGVADAEREHRIPQRHRLEPVGGRAARTERLHPKTMPRAGSQGCLAPRGRHVAVCAGAENGRAQVVAHCRAYTWPHWQAGTRALAQPAVAQDMQAPVDGRRGPSDRLGARSAGQQVERDCASAGGPHRQRRQESVQLVYSQDANQFPSAIGVHRTGGRHPEGTPAIECSGGGTQRAVGRRWRGDGRLRAGHLRQRTQRWRAAFGDQCRRGEC
eukprot:ctg_1948.g549